MTRLLILWLLSEQPQHGYRIHKVLSTPEFAFWFQIEDASIYSMLRTLVKQGFARSEGEDREGNRPLRTHYRITRSGRRELRRRLEAAWRRLERDREPFRAALAAADEFEASEIRGFLRHRKHALEEKQSRLDALGRSAPSGLLARREAAATQSEIAWIDAELGRSNL